MKKKFALGAMCVALALSFMSCDNLTGLGGNDKPSSSSENDYIKVRKDGSFKKIPDWIKGYWSDDEDEFKSISESYYFTDTNVFYDLGRKEFHSFSQIAVLNAGNYNESVTEDTYTLSFSGYYNGVDGYESHTKKDWILKFTKTESGISVTETNGDTTQDALALTKGRLFIPEWLRGTWVSSNGAVELQFTSVNLVAVNVNSGSSLDYTDLILPVVDGKFMEYKRDSGYIEDDVDTSYTLTVTDGNTTLVNKFEKKDSTTITWTQGDTSVDMTMKIE